MIPYDASTVIIAVRPEWLHQCGCAPSLTSETSRWYINLRPASITVWSFVLASSLAYVKRTRWRGGQLWPYVGIDSFGKPLHRDYNAMGDFGTIPPRVPSTCTQNAILSLLIIQDIPSGQMYVAGDNPSLIPSVSCLTTSSYLCNHVRKGDDVSHAAKFQSYACQCFSHMYKFWDGLPSYLSFQVLWWAPGLPSTQRNLHPDLGAWFSIVIAVATAVTHAARHNTSVGIA